MSRHALRASCLASIMLACAPPVLGAPAEALVQKVARGDRLDVRNYSGSVTVTTWDRGEVRVTSSLPGGELLLQRQGSRLLVVPASWAANAPAFAIRLPDMVRVQVTGRPPAAATIEVSAPTWMPVTVEGPHIDVKVTGARAGVDVTVLRGDVTLRSVQGPTAVLAMAGEVLVEDSAGSLTLEGSSRSITVRRCGGVLRAETAEGSMTLEAPTFDRAEVTTLGGAISLRGAPPAGATWELSTHGGDITLDFPEQPDALFSARALRGRVVTNIPLPPGGPDDRLDALAGTGSATVRAVTYSGTIRIVSAAWSD